MKTRVFVCLLLLTLPCFAAQSPEEVVRKLQANFAKIRDARADLTLNTSLQLLGCGGTRRQKGTGLFKYPDRIKASLDKDTYIIKGNSIQRISAEGKWYNIGLIHAPDLSIGFHPGLIPHNFYLKNIKEDENEIVLEGTPKTGVLKNVTKVYFHIDPKLFLLRKLKMAFANKGLSGYAEIKYEKIAGIWVPVATYGKSAVEIASSALVGFNFSLKGENFRINTGLTADELK